MRSTLPPIVTNRSKIEARLQCHHKRHLGFELDGSGLTPIAGAYETEFGILFHKAMDRMLMGEDLSDVTYELSDVCTRLGMSTHQCSEQIDLLNFLCDGWFYLRYPKLMKQYSIVEHEKETVVRFDPFDYLPTALATLMRPIDLQLRRDVLFRDNFTGALVVGDFKTASRASQDWNNNLDNSLQSHLYIEATTIQFPDDYVSGMFYEGLVKGKREIDVAKSSRFNGQVIQYGSPLYGWSKNGVPQLSWSKGCERVYIGYKPHSRWREYNDFGHDPMKNFMTTIPFKPLGTRELIAQIIVNENTWESNKEFWNALPDGHPEKEQYRQVLFERNLNHCFKYGSKHPCAFVDICHSAMERDEIYKLYKKREDHHGSNAEQNDDEGDV